MRTINVQSSLSLSSLPHDHWENADVNNRSNFRPVLNIRDFIKLLERRVSEKIAAGSIAEEQSEQQDEETRSQKGKKRAISPSSSQPAPKRTKVDASTSSTIDVDGTPLEEPLDKVLNNLLNDWPELAHFYPYLDSPPHPLTRFKRETPVLTYVRTDEIQYTVDDGVVDGIPRRSLQWIEEENRLKRAVSALSRSQQVETIDLGSAELWRYQGRIVVSYLDDNLHQWFQWILLLPLHADEADESEDILCCCLTLKAARQLRVEARLKVIILPEGSCDTSSGELPFRIQVETSCSSLYPAIMEKPNFRLKKEANTAQEALCRFRNYLDSAGNSTPRALPDTIDIPYFYSILGPAPFLPSKQMEEAMQPKALVPKLLPFQRRSVAWLLSREGMCITPTGEIVSRQAVLRNGDGDDFDMLPCFWRKIEEANERAWYFNCLSGEVSRMPPAHEDAFGGILAEEPGLGKTLETIALVLLNPASQRNPANKRWDPTARLYVKEVKTTLIVTPISLASQWADELAKHAPSLKVLIYEGWAKLKVPISEAETERLRDKLRQAKEEKAKLNSKPSGGKAKSTTKQDRGKSQTPKTTDGNVIKGVMVDGKLVTEPEDVVDWPTYANSFDVVITTYPVLRAELNLARAAPVRPRREDVVYANIQKPRSPLVSVEWLRVVMDEVQMAGGGRTEDMVGLIPRLSSLAVSGTPAKGQVSDLIHVLRFLRVDGIIGSQKLWNRLLEPSRASDFAAFFQYYAIRTTKASVKNELTIPTQTRFLVPIQLGRVERHVYDQNLEMALLQLGLDARGVAASEGWEVDGVLLRATLRRLRGICTHPQVGQLQLLDKINKPGTLKTMAEVLETLRDQTWRTLMDDRKSKVNALVTQAQFLQMDQAAMNRYQRALQVLLMAEKEGKELVEELRTALTAHEKRVKNTDDTPDELQRRGKGKEVEEDDSVESVDGELTENSPGNKRGALRSRLRETSLALHRVYFVLGDVYHVLGRGTEENDAYAMAEELRKSILRNAEKDAATVMKHLTQDANIQGINQDALLLDTPFLSQSPALKAIEDQRKERRARARAAAGLPSVLESEEESEDSDGSDLDVVKKPKKKKKKPVPIFTLIDEANHIVDILNHQAALMWEWRSRINELLTRKLTSGGEGEADGQEYQRTLDDQGEAESYMQAYTALLADYREALVKERTILAAHDAREKKSRQTRAAMKATRDEAEVSEDIESNLDNQALYVELTFQRKALVEDLNKRAVKSILTDLRNRSSKIKSDKDAEKNLMKEAISIIQPMISERGSLLDKLEHELGQFRKVFNHRVVYFAQLQEISDSVTQPTIEISLQDSTQASIAEVNELNARINTGRARGRYLDHLSQADNDGEGLDEDDQACILCRCEFARGYITNCAHIFCEPCLKAWLARKEGKTCPVCRIPITSGEMQRFTMNGPSKPAEAKPTGDVAVPKSRRIIEYNTIDPFLLEKIQTMESFGDFGSKIQTLVKHLLYLQREEPGSKSICFSAWQDSLHILERALIDNGISCLRIDQNKSHQSAAKKFRTDPDILVLLLHGERENAGLNVTCASRVFLLESVVHHGFEIQAIARIDRMGQTRSTEVYCYYAEDTVERNILDLAARQGLSLYTKDNAAGTLNTTRFGGGDRQDVKHAEAKEKRKGKTQKGDFIGKIDDMLAIMFPHMYEDVQYMIPENADTDHEGDVGGDTEMASASQDNVIQNNTEVNGATRSGRGRRAQINAVAGPSRLRRR